MHSDQLCAVGKRRLDLNLENHFRNPVHHISTCQQGRAITHEISDAATVLSYTLFSVTKPLSTNGAGVMFAARTGATAV